MGAMAISAMDTEMMVLMTKMMPGPGSTDGMVVQTDPTTQVAAIRGATSPAVAATSRGTAPTSGAFYDTVGQGHSGPGG